MAVNFTTNFSVNEVVHYNVSYLIANQPPQMTTPIVWIVFSVLGVGLLLLSAIGKQQIYNDLSGVLALIFLGISAVHAFAVDTVTGFGVAGMLDSGVKEFVLMEHHTIYHYDFWGVALGILFVISIANLYRLWLDYKRISEQEQVGVDRMSIRQRGAGNTNNNIRGGRGAGGNKEPDAE